MLSNRLVPALLIVLPTTTLLAAQATFSEAAAECKVRPGSSAPRGEHWYWRVDRATNQRCWFLATRDAVRSQGRPAISYRGVRPHNAVSTTHAEQDGKPDLHNALATTRAGRDGKPDLQSTAAQAPAAGLASAGLSATKPTAGLASAGLSATKPTARLASASLSAAEQELADFSARWPELQTVGDLQAPAATTTMSYTDEPASAVRPVGIQAERDARRPSRDENATPSLRGPLLIALLLLAGGGLTLVRRLDRSASRDDRQPIERRPEIDSDFARTDRISAPWRKVSAWIRTPTDPPMAWRRMGVDRGGPRVSPPRRARLRLP